MANGNGGARPGAGRPKGKLSPEAAAEQEAIKSLRRRRVRVLDRIFNAQLTLAEGCTFVYEVVETGDGKNKKREHVLVTDPERIKDFLDDPQGTNVDGNVMFITTEKPDGRMIVDMMDRIGGKPAQAIEVTNVTPESDTRELHDDDLDSELTALRAALMDSRAREGATPGETEKEGVN